MGRWSYYNEMSNCKLWHAKIYWQFQLKGKSFSFLNKSLNFRRLKLDNFQEACMILATVSRHKFHSHSANSDSWEVIILAGSLRNNPSLSYIRLGRARGRVRGAKLLGHMLLHNYQLNINMLVFGLQKNHSCTKIMFDE